MVKKFASKAAATKGGVLEKAVGGMGSVESGSATERSKKSGLIRVAWIPAGEAEPRPEFSAFGVTEAGRPDGR